MLDLSATPPITCVTCAPGNSNVEDPRHPAAPDRRHAARSPVAAQAAAGGTTSAGQSAGPDTAGPAAPADRQHRGTGTQPGGDRTWHGAEAGGCQGAAPARTAGVARARRPAAAAAGGAFGNGTPAVTAGTSTGGQRVAHPGTNSKAGRGTAPTHHDPAGQRSALDSAHPDPDSTRDRTKRCISRSSPGQRTAGGPGGRQGAAAETAGRVARRREVAGKSGAPDGRRRRAAGSRTRHGCRFAVQSPDPACRRVDRAHTVAAGRRVAGGRGPAPGMATRPADPAAGRDPRGDAAYRA